MNNKTILVNRKINTLNLSEAGDFSKTLKYSGKTNTKKYQELKDHIKKLIYIKIR